MLLSGYKDFLFIKLYLFKQKKIDKSYFKSKKMQVLKKD